MRKRNLFTVNESERERILNLHENATKQQYLGETMEMPLEDADITKTLMDQTGASQEEAEFAVCTAPSEVQSKFNNSKLGELFKKIEGLDLSSLKNLFKEIKGKMSQKNEQAGAVAGTMILGVPVSYVLLGLVALGVLTSIISRMGGGRRGYSSGGGCKAKRRQQKRGLGIFGNISI
jgi:hypothetical protein